MRTFYIDHGNIGDTLTPIILEYFTNHKAELVGYTESNKLLMVGSFLELIKKGDTVLGIGLNKPDYYLEQTEDVRFLSVRGPLTRDHIRNETEIPEIYGDPALLLPLIYNPKIEKTKKLGIIPHYIEKPLFTNIEIIDIEQDWKTFVDEIKSYEQIISSTLHGIVIAEAYGIPARWGVFSNKVGGGEFKYQDYFLGTGRERQIPFAQLPPIENLEYIQNKLIEQLKKL